MVPSWAINLKMVCVMEGSVRSILQELSFSKALVLSQDAGNNRERQKIVALPVYKMSLVTLSG